MLTENQIRISMDGKDCWRDNVFVERLWHTMKYEAAYLKAYDSVSPAKASLARYFEFYNRHRGRTGSVLLQRAAPTQGRFNRQGHPLGQPGMAVQMSGATSVVMFFN